MSTVSQAHPFSPDHKEAMQMNGEVIKMRVNHKEPTQVGTTLLEPTHMRPTLLEDKQGSGYKIEISDFDRLLDTSPIDGEGGSIVNGEGGSIVTSIVSSTRGERGDRSPSNRTVPLSTRTVPLSNRTPSYTDPTSHKHREFISNVTNLPNFASAPNSASVPNIDLNIALNNSASNIASSYVMSLTGQISSMVSSNASVVISARESDSNNVVTKADTSLNGEPLDVSNKTIGLSAEPLKSNVSNQDAKELSQNSPNAGRQALDPPNASSSNAASGNAGRQAIDALTKLVDAGIKKSGVAVKAKAPGAGTKPGSKPIGYGSDGKLLNVTSNHVKQQANVHQRKLDLANTRRPSLSVSLNAGVCATLEDILEGKNGSSNVVDDCIPSSKYGFPSCADWHGRSGKEANEGTIGEETVLRANNNGAWKICKNRTGKTAAEISAERAQEEAKLLFAEQHDIDASIIKSLDAPSSLLHTHDLNKKLQVCVLHPLPDCFVLEFYVKIGKTVSSGSRTPLFVKTVQKVIQQNKSKKDFNAVGKDKLLEKARPIVLSLSARNAPAESLCVWTDGPRVRVAFLTLRSNDTVAYEKCEFFLKVPNNTANKTSKKFTPVKIVLSSNEAQVHVQGQTKIVPLGEGIVWLCDKGTNVDIMGNTRGGDGASDANTKPDNNIPQSFGTKSGTSRNLKPALPSNAKNSSNSNRNKGGAALNEDDGKDGSKSKKPNDGPSVLDSTEILMTVGSNTSSLDDWVIKDLVLTHFESDIDNRNDDIRLGGRRSLIKALENSSYRLYELLSGFGGGWRKKLAKIARHSPDIVKSYDVSRLNCFEDDKDGIICLSGEDIEHLLEENENEHDEFLSDIPSNNPGSLARGGSFESGVASTSGNANSFQPKNGKKSRVVAPRITFALDGSTVEVMRHENSRKNSEGRKSSVTRRPRQTRRITSLIGNKTCQIQ